MGTVRVVAKNIGAFTIAKAITMALGFVFLVLLARYLGDVDFGKLGFAQSFTEFLVVFADIGLSTVTIRELARRKDQTPKFLSNIFMIKLLLSIATFGLIALVINLLGYPQDTVMVVYIIGGSAIITSFSAFLRSIFRAFERLEYEAALNIVKSIIVTSVGISILFAGYGLIEVAYAYIIAAVIDFGLALILVTFKFSRPEFKLDPEFCKRIIYLALPFTVTILFGIIYLQIDIVMLSIMKGDAPAGWYKAATTLIYSLVFIPEVFGYAIFPVMSRLFISSKELLRRLLERSMKYLFMIGLPIAILTVAVSGEIIPFLYGEEYEPTIMILQILALYLPLRFMNHATGYTLSSTDRQSRRAISAILAAVFNVCLNLILIPIYGANGAAMATVATEVVLFSFYYLFVSAHFHRVKLTPVLTKPLIASLPMIFTLYLLADFSPFISVPLAVMIYLAVLFLINGMDQEDRRIIRELLGR
ncbi:MAG: flippase [Methanomassiliicoccales archaeon]|nr:flippase [Methanomassiliicoccales archaeon]NYT15775.1 flippase [Methanomassiliicoccales archaeon]